MTYRSKSARFSPRSARGIGSLAMIKFYRQFWAIPSCLTTAVMGRYVHRLRSGEGSARKEEMCGKKINPNGKVY